MASSGSVAVVLASLAALAGAFAQSEAMAQAQPAPLSNPNLDLRTPGRAVSIARLNDGSFIVGGRFNSAYDPASGLSLPRTHLAKFSASGALDLSWNPVFGSSFDSVEMVLSDGVGSIYFGGYSWAPAPPQARQTRAGTRHRTPASGHSQHRLQASCCSK